MKKTVKALLCLLTVFILSVVVSPQIVFALELPAATQKNTPAAPTVGKTDCTTKDNNDGKITGVDSSMEYQMPNDPSWHEIDAGVDEIIGCTPGTYHVRYKATDTSNASETAEVVIEKFSITVSVEANNPVYGTVSGGGKFYYDDVVTCVAEPNEGYVFDCWTEGGKRVDGAKAIYDFKAEQDRTLTANFREVLIGDIPSQAYTGDPVTPTGFTVELEGVDVKLQAGTDYDIGYADNENAGTKAKAILTFKGDFSGTAAKKFTIIPASISTAAIKFDPQEYEYEGKEIKPVPEVKWNGKQLAAGTDFTLSYAGNVEPGTATVTVTGQGNFTGIKTATFKITPGKISGMTVELEKTDYEYEGKEIRPVPTVKWNGKQLAAGTDFTLSYAGNVEPGTATVTVTGQGNFTGTTSITFTIEKRQAVIKVDDAFKKLNEDDPVFTGTVEGLIAPDDLGEITYYRTNTDETEGTYQGVLAARYTPNQNYIVDLKYGDFSIVNNDGYTVTFEDGAGRTETVTNVSGNYSLPKCMFTAPEGQTFNCWTVNGTDHNEGDTITVTEDTTVTAKWKDIPQHVHILDLVEAKEATCTEDGNRIYYVCSICGLWFEDATAVVEIRDKDSVIIKALGHKWDEGVVTKEATYTEEGIRTFTCLNDASHTKTETIPKKRRSSGGSGGSGSSSSVGSRSASSGSGSWNQDDTGWHYTENGVLVKNAWRYISYNGVSYWYFFDETGTMKTGWLDWNGERYYLYPVSDGWKGRMVTGWQQIDGKWYFFETASGSAQGRMYRSEKTPDGYYAGPDGAWDGNPAGTGR